LPICVLYGIIEVEGIQIRNLISWLRELFANPEYKEFNPDKFSFSARTTNTEGAAVTINGTIENGWLVIELKPLNIAQGQIHKLLQSRCEVQLTYPESPNPHGEPVEMTIRIENTHNPKYFHTLNEYDPTTGSVSSSGIAKLIHPNLGEIELCNLTDIDFGPFRVVGRFSHS